MKIALTIFAIVIVALPIIFFPAIELDIITVPAAIAIVTWTWAIER